jgi:HD-GYP domain-containing protein (c-di-GMP phosphodiesterase class II)
MRRIIIREARPGMRLGRAIPSPRQPSTPLAPAGADLSIPLLLAMHHQGVYDLWIEEPELHFLDDLSASHLSPSQHRLVDAFRHTFRQLFRQGIATADLLPNTPGGGLFKRYRLLLEELVRGIVRSAPVVPCFPAFTSEHEPLLRHSAAVSVYCMFLGLQLEGYLVDQRRRLTCRQARDVLNLALGSLFHDIGELFTPPQHRESHADWSLAPCAAAPLPDPSSDAWKHHTAHGFAAVRKYLDPSAAAVVLHHHQHYDGSGFAISDSRELQQRGKTIHVFARIASVADAFAHLLLPAGAGIPNPFLRPLWQIQQPPLRDRFDPTVLHALLAMVPPFAPGMIVTLSDWRTAMVTALHPEAPCCPEVQILAASTPGTTSSDPPRSDSPAIIPSAELPRIDLRHSPIYIAEVEGARIAEFLFGRRPHPQSAAA